MGGEREGECGCGGELGCFLFQTIVTGDRREVHGWLVLCMCVHAHGTDRSWQNKAQSVLPQVLRRRGGREEGRKDEGQPVAPDPLKYPPR